ncbi:MAG: FMN-binding protein [Elusimicrobia bacterium]|jgi:electron transport complex protein RnfG|nr:FMN-binding protein [Elusimicrobiota bacterium]
MKNLTIKMLLVLGGVSVISAGFLGYVYTATYDRIELNREKRVKEAIYKVLPEIDDYEKISAEPDIFKGTGGGVKSGYAVLAGGMGFQGEITMMVGVNEEVNRLMGISVLESVETPGLGDKIKGIDFRKQFRGMPILRQKGIKVNAITGATISSDAVEKIIQKAIKDVKRIH